MTNLSARRGSALLIVLGMVGVMVISAVAFSAYMRYSRLPSSYLRRTSASRHLAHAAMAEAIDIIDASIGDNPHPGVGLAATLYPRETGRSAIRNYWRDHCYIGTNELVSSEKTVSVLTLEALAYVPPALVNEIRYFSRHSPAASWQRLGYDSGRFAFCAIDVSDHFDVNRVPADYGRNSSDGGKFSLAFAFENNAHTSYTISPSAWDSFIENYVDIDALRIPGKAPSTSKMPFVSLADLGLALYGKAGSIASEVFPFMSYLVSGGSGLNGIEDLPGADMIRRFNVISDGLCPSSATKKNQEGDLSSRQPFPRMKKGSAKTTNREVLTLVDNGTSRLIEENMTLLDMISLYDYLDDNDLPVSLALPTTERVPMVCGLQTALQMDFTPEVNEVNEPEEKDVNEVGQFYFKTSHCKLKFTAAGGFSGMYMFPFLRDKDVPSSGYTAETALRICFGTASPRLRTVSGSAYLVQNGSDFSATGVGGCAMRPKVQSGNLSWSDVKTPEDAVEKKDSTVNFSEVRTWFSDNDLFWVKQKFVLKAKDEFGNKTFEEDVGAKEAWVNPEFHPIGDDGKGDGGFTVDVLKKGGSVTVKPYMTAAVRITKGGDTLDLVPASYEDDVKYNAVNSDKNIANIGGSTDRQPIITFSGNKEIVFGLESFAKKETVTVAIQPTDAQSIFCPDPRWNFAPENFVRINQPLDKTWFTDSANPKCGIGDNGRDRDLFMFVSNQGYMQSVSELAFLPRTSYDLGGGSTTTGNAAFSFDYDDFPTEVANAKNWNLMWRTYRLYPQGGLSSDGLYNIGLFDGGRGFRMNPYTPSRTALLSALANPPYSWWAASTNDQAVGKSSVVDADATTFNRDYAFSAMNSKAKFAWKDMELLADSIGAAMRSNANGDWCAGYDSLDWAGDDEHFAGVQLSSETCDLYDVDRKFLYGFWRDCFAAKQQLFLVFVRAEPMMMGGGAAGQAPPQLGSRAMALVWRNPAAGSVTGVAGGDKAWPDSLSETRDEVLKGRSGGSSAADANRPHRTRMLFYRQFD